MVQDLRTGVRGFKFHDLRGSDVVRLALDEATMPQISTFTGQTEAIGVSFSLLIC
jgi:hypothetical protein